MILVDMNQVTISNLMMQIKHNDLSVDLVRHLVLNSIRSYRTKFSNDYGELILCYDDKHYWRREYFPNYKSNRKKDRTDSSLNWNELFETLKLLLFFIMLKFSTHSVKSFVLPLRISTKLISYQISILSFPEI